ncbi:MAG: hypothetical protein FJ030_14165 [Chloroflexi bacterium]|nr:hypothetical protein [Chloroflexota bacterium]
MSVTTEEPMTIKLVANDGEALQRAIYKWVKFQQSMWAQVAEKLEWPSRMCNRWSIILRLTIIILSTALTTFSNLSEVPRNGITLTAGVITGLTAIEAFFRLSEKHGEMKKQQREIEALRDKLRYEWMVAVELETNMEKQLVEAKRLLKEGPAAYNEILNKYAVSKEGDKPQATGA